MSTDELIRVATKAASGGLYLFIGNTSSTVILAVGVIIVARLLGGTRQCARKSMDRVAK